MPPGSADKLQQNLTTHMVLHVSPMPCNDIVVGRPYGGCAVIYRTNSQIHCQKIVSSNKRICPAILYIGDVKILVICAYLPIDRYHSTDPELMDTLQESSRIIASQNIDMIVFSGDLNVDPSRPSSHLNAVKNFAASEGLLFGYNHALATPGYTYESKANGSRSQLDHCLMTPNLYSLMKSYKPIYFGDNLSDHSPVSCTYDIDIHKTTPVIVADPKFAWDKASTQQKFEYRRSMDEILSSTAPFPELMSCRDLNCKSEIHHRMIDTMCDTIISTILNAADVSIPLASKTSKRKHVIPGWNEMVRPLRESSLFWHQIWKDCGRPQSGALYEIRRQTRARYQLAVRECKRLADNTSADKLAVAITNEVNQTQFWNNVKRIRNCHKPPTSQMDGKTGPDNIANVLKDKYNELYNRNCYDVDEMNQLINDVEGMIDKCSTGHCTERHSINVTDIKKAVLQLKCGKRDGETMFSSDHIIEGSHRLHICISVLFNCILTHGYIPPVIRKTSIISIPKDHKKSIADSNNYRGIALSHSLSKLLEIVLVAQHRESLMSSNMQFGYKAKSSTTQCTYVLNEVTEYYNSNDSDVYVILLDASRAFDLVHYVKLFRLLLTGGCDPHCEANPRNYFSNKFPGNDKIKMCPVAIRLLMYCHLHQIIRTKWLNSVSEHFTAQNGVKQGGIVSPYLFTLYIDVLLNRLQQSGSGCYLGKIFVGALSYADDICLLSPTKYGIQSMLEIVSSFSKEFHVQFNPSKSKFLFYPRNNIYEKLTVNFDGIVIENSESAMHLGHLIGPGNTVKREAIDIFVNNLYSKFNVIMSEFHACSAEVKLKMFNSFCMHNYGTMLWNLEYVAPLEVAWRKCIRRMYKLDRRTHCKLLPHIVNQDSIDVTLHRQYLKFIKGCVNSENDILSLCSRIACEYSPCISNTNLSMICHRYSTDKETLMEQSIRKIKVRSKMEDVVRGLLIRDLIDFSKICQPNDKQNCWYIIHMLCVN